MTTKCKAGKKKILFTCVQPEKHPTDSSERHSPIIFSKTGRACPTWSILVCGSGCSHFTIDLCFIYEKMDDHASSSISEYIVNLNDAVIQTLII